MPDHLATTRDPRDQAMEALASPPVSKIEQYITSALAAFAFVAGGIHPGFQMPVIPSAVIASTSAVVFGAINIAAWVLNHLHKKAVATTAAQLALNSGVDRTQ